MRRILSLLISLVVAAAAGIFFVHVRPVSAADAVTAHWTPAAPSTQPAGTTYNPYPTGILPSNIDSEIQRVRTEINFIFSEAIAQWQALPALTLSSNPPIFQGNGYQAEIVLGELFNYDENMSPFHNRACAFCHMPYTGFKGPIPSVNLTMVAYPGSMQYRAAKRTAQSYTYAPRFPVLQLYPDQNLLFGGNFWDGRATGYLLQSPDAEQAQHPPVDPLEMGLPDTACIAWRLTQASYLPLYQAIYGPYTISWPGNTEQICSTPNGASAFGTSATPIALSPGDRATANSVYNHWGQALSFYQASPNVSPYTSKIDANLNGVPGSTYSSDELAGAVLFAGQGNCNSCHIDGQRTTLTSSETDTGVYAANARPLFTCFGFSNLGLPLNAAISLFYETTYDYYGFQPNPYGFGYRDLGLGTFLRSGYGSGPNPNSNWNSLAPQMDGRMQVSSIRNVAMTPPQCPTTEAPGPYFQKEFFHNGYIKSLKQLVHFYNTRDVYAMPVTSGHCPAGTVEKVNCWPMPEVSNNMDMTVGKLGLTDAQENQLVLILQDATDGWQPNGGASTYPNINTYTGTCMSGGTAATQGNTSIVPVPTPLPPCASAICGVAPLPSGPIQ
jgi:cytochrome c peroxidase